MPFSVTIASSSGSAVNTLLLSSAKVKLVKRNTAWNNGRPHLKQEILVGAADSLRTEMLSDGACVLSGKVRISCNADAHQSWDVERLAGKEVRFYTNVSAAMTLKCLIVFYPSFSSATNQHGCAPSVIQLRASCICDYGCI